MVFGHGDSKLFFLQLTAGLSSIKKSYLTFYISGKNINYQFNIFIVQKIGSSFRSKACCHWGVNFQFKHIEHIEAKSNFLYGPPSRHSVALFNSELWQFFRCNCIVMTFGKGRTKVTAQGEVV